MSHDVHPVDIQFDRRRRRIACIAGIIDARRQAGEIGDRHGRQSMHTPGSPNVSADLDLQTHCSQPLGQSMTWCIRTRAKRRVKIPTEMPISTRRVPMNSRIALCHELRLPATAPRPLCLHDWG